ncbi:MAG: hypothetical protein IJU67_03735 [Lachnospiraceae bacterium]|nr:hypothetical protein [Lachnospiraceae bacterium]
MKIFPAKHLYLTHLRRFRVAGVLYLIFLLVWVPYSAYTSIADVRWTSEPLWNAASGLAYLFDSRIEPFTVAFAALVMSLLVFGYLFTARSANMMHSLPAGRASLFRAGVGGALTLMWVPQMIAAAVSLIPIALSHTGLFWMAGWWFLATALMSVFFVGLAAICVMFAGRAGSAILFYLILNFVYAGIRFIANGLASMFVFGLQRSAMELGPYFMTPLVWLMRAGVTHTDTVVPDRLPDRPAELLEWFRPDGVPRVLIMAAVGACFCLLAYAVYRKRRVETAGSFLAVDWMKPVFKIGLSAGVALAVSAVAVGFETDAGVIRGTGTAFAAMILQALIIGLVAWFIVEMMIRRSVRVFTKKQWLGWGVFSVCIVILLFLLRFDAFGIERRVPDPSRVNGAVMQVYGDQLQTEDPEQIREIEEIQRMIVEDRREIRDYEEYSMWNYDYENRQTVGFTYVMPNGSLMRRNYVLNRNDEAGARILDRIDELVNRPENAERLLLGEYADIYELSYAEIQYYQLQTDGGGAYWYDSAFMNLSLSRADCDALLEAIRKDIAEGHLRVGSSQADDYANTLILNFADPENPGPENGNYDYRELTLNASCTHTLEALLRSPNFASSDLITVREITLVESGEVVPDAGDTPGVINMD